MDILGKKFIKRAIRAICADNGLVWYFYESPTVSPPPPLRVAVYWGLADDLRNIMVFHTRGRGVRGVEVKTILCQFSGELV